MSHVAQVPSGSVTRPSVSVATASTAIPEEDYKKSVEMLKSEWEKDKQGALALMAITYDRRREWITGEADSIHSIIKEFPCLKSYDFVS